VGWDIREQVERIWAGERDSEALGEGSSPKVQAALVSILYHVQQMESKWGPAPARHPQQAQARQQPE
jgi:hypothetical protein